MTANAMNADRKRCLDAGMVDFVVKPIEPDQLFKTLLRWTSKGGASVTHRDTQLPTGALVADVSVLMTQVDGLDVQAGLRRVMGREDRYLTLLKNFVTEQANAPARIEQALSDGGVQDAKRAAHTLLGLAGTIGAHVLYAATQKLEQAIGSSTTVVEHLLEVADVLQALVQALQTVLQQSAVEQRAIPLAIDLDAQREAMDLLRTMLQNDDANAQRHFLDHAGLFEVLLGQHFPHVRNAIDSLALDEALELVESLSLPP